MPGLKRANGSREVNRLVATLKEEDQFDLQLGRVLACHLLRKPDKINWKESKLKEERERELIEELRNEFNY